MRAPGRSRRSCGVSKPCAAPSAVDVDRARAAGLVDRAALVDVGLAEGPGEELAGPGVLRVVDDLLRRADLDEHALLDEVDAVGRLAGERHLVGDHDHRRALVGQLLHHVDHLADERRVEGRRRLVEQQHLGLHRQRPGDGHALLLAARQARRVLVALVATGRPCPGIARRWRSPGRAGTPFTRTGASMRLSITRRCGNRLNSWNTIWARSRICRICSRWARSRGVERVGRHPDAVDLDRARPWAPRGS